MDRVIAASTHPWAYKLHKYWSRKPHNVLAGLIEELTPPDGVVVDPFCGSGVFLREAGIRGRSAIGFDVNPIAVLLSRVTANAPALDSFSDAMAPILSEAESLAQELYNYKGSDPAIRYVTHELITVCPSCGDQVGAASAVRNGRSHCCPSCTRKVRFNLDTMTGTRVIRVAFESVGIQTSPTSLLLEQRRRSELGYPIGRSFDARMTDNSRTLAYSGMKVSDLFTPRNWSILCRCAELVHAISDESLRDAGLLWLTASVAQCSRLIADRGQLTGGGPAWTVPGFWVPPIHLETNPAIHLRARLSKFASGLTELENTPLQAPVTVSLQDAVTGLRSVASAGRKVSLVFLDPPYGDSVPYLEFSTLWNAFLQQVPEPSADIAVSDRKGSPSRWEDYELRLKESIQAASEVLGSDGRMLITFNNNDIRPWIALLSALQSAGLICESVWYQIPAVVPSKAQFSPKGSYISDIYAIFSREQSSSRVGTVDDVKAALGSCAQARHGLVPRTVARRVLLISWMENNLPADELTQIEALLSELFEKNDESLKWRGDLECDRPSLQAIVQRMVESRVTQQGYPWVELYAEIATAMVKCGVPDPWEIRECWGSVKLQGRLCVSADLKQPRSAENTAEVLEQVLPLSYRERDEYSDLSGTSGSVEPSVSGRP